jgi:hypothetical protein
MVMLRYNSMLNTAKKLQKHVKIQVAWDCPSKSQPQRPCCDDKQGNDPPKPRCEASGQGLCGTGMVIHQCHETRCIYACHRCRWWSLISSLLLQSFLETREQKPDCTDSRPSTDSPVGRLLQKKIDTLQQGAGKYGTPLWVLGTVVRHLPAVTYKMLTTGTSVSCPCPDCSHESQVSCWLM